MHGSNKEVRGTIQWVMRSLNEQGHSLTKKKVCRQRLRYVFLHTDRCENVSFAKPDAAYFSVIIISYSKYMKISRRSLGRQDLRKNGIREIFF